MQKLKADSFARSVSSKKQLSFVVHMDAEQLNRVAESI